MDPVVRRGAAPYRVLLRREGTRGVAGANAPDGGTGQRKGRGAGTVKTRLSRSSARSALARRVARWMQQERMQSLVKVMEIFILGLAGPIICYDLNRG